MNNDLNIDRVVRQMREAAIPKVELSDGVMKKVYDSHTVKPATRVQARKRHKMTPVWAAMLTLLLISATSVGAAALFNTDWNNVQIKIGAYNPAPAPETPVEEDFDIEAAVANAAHLWQKVSLEQSAIAYHFNPLRPQEGELALLKSFGVIYSGPENKTWQPNERWLGGIYDVFQGNESVIVAKQQLNTLMTETLRDPEKTLSYTYEEVAWENVINTDDTVAMFAPTSDGNMLEINHKTTDLNVITLDITGGSKEELLAVAETYLTK
ncbi:hypothetical protein A7K91_20105 [Paenibacillus oryzae]|uniref:DUF4367 domain-containing protein n=1 Tax=Paenibacillus oryzae TaxID=1844972 RepID=A0A1A5YI95_9BACL|nr:hypothetical protein [Paenibacillus oryzae]OBR65288.1 hypothetical protein A7K91_20105 [Paenibacillus oryzae]